MLLSAVGVLWREMMAITEQNRASSLTAEESLRSAVVSNRLLKLRTQRKKTVRTQRTYQHDRMCLV